MKVKVIVADKEGDNRIEFYTYGVMGMDFIHPIIEAGYSIHMYMVDDD